jgi:nucleoside 2-deoxyribosyltransferase
MKIYVAAHCRWAGLHAASVLKSSGHEITSRWLQKTFLPVSEHTPEERCEIALEDVEDVLRADALVLVAGPDKYSGGKFVEAGIALGLGKSVVVIGRRENMLLWHPAVVAVDTPEQASHVL